jgi:hypothetical protein
MPTLLRTPSMFQPPEQWQGATSRVVRRPDEASALLRVVARDPGVAVSDAAQVDCMSQRAARSRRGSQTVSWSAKVALAALQRSWDCRGSASSG